MAFAVSDDVSERYLDFKRGLWLSFAAHDVQFMTSAIDNSMPATRPGLNEHMVRSDHAESRIIVSK